MTDLCATTPTPQMKCHCAGEPFLSARTGPLGGDISPSWRPGADTDKYLCYQEQQWGTCRLVACRPADSGAEAGAGAASRGAFLTS